MNRAILFRVGFEKVAELLIQNGADVNAIGQDGNTALIWCVYNGLETAAELLIQKGAHVNVAGTDNDTPVIWAANRGFMSKRSIFFLYFSDWQRIQKSVL